MAGRRLSTAWLLLCVAAFSQAAPAADLITSLPGVDFATSYAQYSGYLDGETGNHLHYWFVESQGDPTTDPLVLWLTGGPGCSGLDALLEENGPIHIDANGTLYNNPYSWNTLANVIYLESPVGVGFSYSDSGDYNTTDDDTVSLNNYLALQDFISKFPEYSGRDFYITGESYGGIYVPTLAVRVLTGDLNVSFQGFAIGNGMLSYPLNDNSLVFVARYHGLIAESLFEELVEHCCGGEESQAACNFASPPNLICLLRVLQVEVQVNANGLNPYNILSPCQYSDDQASSDTFAKRLLFRNLKTPENKIRQDRMRSKNTNRESKALGLDPTCIDSSNIANWLNQDSVLQSLHIASEALPWEICSEAVNSGYQTLYRDMTDQFNQLLPSVRALVYNGDFDIACNFLGDQWFVERLNRTVVKDYDFWTDTDGIVAGYGKAYDNLQFTTIRGAGHMVPQDQPARALLMFKKFLHDRNF